MTDSNYNIRQKVRLKINELISRQLEKGQYRLPTELTLAESLQVSRSTIREVLSELAQEGWVLRRHGHGTFINPTLAQMKSPLTPMPYFWDIIAGYGKTPGIQFIDYALAQNPEHIAEHLKIPKDHDIIRLTLAYSADQDFCIVCHDYFGIGLIDKDTFAPMKQCSIFQMLYESSGRVVAWANTMISASDTQRAPEVGRLMKIPPDRYKSLLLVKNICYDTKHQPLLYSESFFDTDLIEFGYVQQYGTGRKVDTSQYPVSHK